MKRHLVTYPLLALLWFSLSGGCYSNELVEVYFISPQADSTLKNPIIVRFGLRNMGVAPAGIQAENTGHHHLLIDTDLPPLDQPVPSDENHRHFGKGQTETSLELSPGKHTLQLLFADYAHTPHQPAVMSEKITITVE